MRAVVVGHGTMGRIHATIGFSIRMCMPRASASDADAARCGRRDDTGKVSRLRQLCEQLQVGVCGRIGVDRQGLEAELTKHPGIGPRVPRADDLCLDLLTHERDVLRYLGFEPEIQYSAVTGKHALVCLSLDDGASATVETAS